MKKTLSILLAALMLVSSIPIFASAATISLTRSNVVLIPPTASVDEIKYGESLATITVSGGQLWYVDEEGNRTEVKGYFDIRNKATLSPASTGEYNLPLVFYPEDTATYGEASGSLSYLTMKNKIVSGEWPSVYLRGTYTEIVTPPSFTCDAGDNLLYYTSYTKTGGKVVDANGTNVTSSGQFYIDDTSTGGKNQFLYEDTYVTARWDGKSKSGYESAYYENVLVKVTRKTATLETAPSIPSVLIGTTYGGALTKLTAKVSLVGSKTSYDTSYKYWVPAYPEGVTAETPLTEDTTITVTYQNPATDDTFTAEVEIDVYSKPLAVISEKPAIDATDIKPGLKASSLTLTGGKAVKEGTETEVSGTFSIKNPDTVLTSGYNTIDIVFTPDDTENYDGTSTTVHVKIASLITTVPTLDATGLRAGAKASELTLTGGEATEEGTFVIADPEQELIAGTNKITVKFVPAAEGAEYYETKVISVIVQSEFRILDANGNDAVPVYTVTYGTYLKDGMFNWDKFLSDCGCYLNASKDDVYYSYNAPDGQDAIISDNWKGVILPVGEHKFTMKVTQFGYSIYETPKYVPTLLDIIIKVEPVMMNVNTVHYNYVSKEITVTIDNLGAKGTLDIYIDDVLVGDDIETVTYGLDTFRTATITDWEPTVTDTEYNRDYKVKVVYNSVENDPVGMEDYESVFRTKIAIPIESPDELPDMIDGAVDGTRVKCYFPNYLADLGFVQWYITDLNGNELDLEIYDIVTEWDPDKREYVEVGTEEAALTDTTIYFNMPNFPIKISYKTQAMIEAEAKKEAIDNCDCICHHNNPVSQFIWKIISFFMNLFGIEKDCACGYPHGTK